MKMITRQMSGQYIGKIDGGSPAEAAGLREGDRIVEVFKILGSEFESCPQCKYHGEYLIIVTIFTANKYVDD